MEERRQNVRVRPDTDLPTSVAIVREGGDATLDVLDVSIGGFGFLLRGHELEIGQQIEVRVTLPGMVPFTTAAIVRHVRSGSGGDRAGVHLPELEEDQARALRRYVGELFERGLRVT